MSERDMDEKGKPEVKQLGKDYFCYAVLLTSHFTAIGFDPRPIEEIERELIAAQCRFARGFTAGKARVMAVRMRNERTAKKVIEGEAFEEAEPDVEAEPLVQASPEWFFRLRGIPEANGYGALSIIADQVIGVSYVDYLDLSKTMPK